MAAPLSQGALSSLCSPLSYGARFTLVSSTPQGKEINLSESHRHGCAGRTERCMPKKMGAGETAYALPHLSRRRAAKHGPLLNPRARAWVSLQLRPQDRAGLHAASACKGQASRSRLHHRRPVQRERRAPSPSRRTTKAPPSFPSATPLPRPIPPPAQLTSQRPGQGRAATRDRRVVARPHVEGGVVFEEERPFGGVERRSRLLRGQDVRVRAGGGAGRGGGGTSRDGLLGLLGGFGVDRHRRVESEEGRARYNKWVQPNSFLRPFTLRSLCVSSRVAGRADRFSTRVRARVP